MDKESPLASESDEEEEPKEVKTLSISLTNKNNLYATEVSTLYVQRRNSVGTKFKLDKDEYVISNITANNNDTILFFTNMERIVSVMFHTNR